MTVWIIRVDTSVDTSKRVAHRDWLKVFANVEAAEQWFRNDGYPDLAASKYEIVCSKQSDPNVTGRKSLWIYFDTRKRLGSDNRLMVFADLNAAEKWFAENDPEGEAFEYEVLD
jgi:hypothetical protein